MKRKWIFNMHRSPEGDGGAGLGPSLSDILSGTGDKLPDLSEEGQRQQQQAEESLNEDGTLKEGYIKGEDGKVVKDPNSGGQPEGLNADGTLQDGFKKDEQGNVVRDPEYKPAAGDDDEDEDYWEATEKIAGFKLRDGIEYPEGIKADTPEAQQWFTTPEGTAAIIKGQREQAAVEFEEYLKEKNPRGYAFLLHLEAGGTEEEFLSDNRGVQLPKIEELTASADIQARVYKYDLLVRGLDEDAAQALVDKAIKDNKLLERSTAAWTQMDEAQKKQLKDLEDKKEAGNKKFDDDLKAMTTRLQKAIKEELAFIVPDNQQPALQKYITDNMRYDNGKFYIVQEVGNEGLKTLVESLLFQYKKGNLKDLVAKESKTVAAQRLRLRTVKGDGTPGDGSDASRSQSKHLPLSAIL